MYAYGYLSDDDNFKIEVSKWKMNQGGHLDMY